MAVQKYGVISRASHPVVTRSVQRSDNTTLEIQIVGDYNSLENTILSKAVGEDVGLICGDTKGDNFAGYRIKSLSATREDGEIGVLSASLVKCDSVGKPYHVTYSIEMQEDQRSLLRHPLFKDNDEAIEQIQYWNATNPGARVKMEEGKLKFFYQKYSGSASGAMDEYEVTNEAAIKYCTAVFKGLETFNVYLPVITKTSLYLKEPPGSTQDDVTHEISGTVEYSTNIGKWDDSFGFVLEGYETTDKQGWFKSADSYTQNSDGTWQRVEMWVFSDSKEHSWIYEDANGGGKK